MLKKVIKCQQAIQFLFIQGADFISTAEKPD